MRLRLPRTTEIPEATLRRYDALLATQPGTERKGAAMPYTSVNGHMFSFLTPAGTLALRLPQAERDRFLATYATQLVEQHGRELKEYVAVPDDLLARTDELAPYVARSCEYVASLRPKPSR